MTAIIEMTKEEVVAAIERARRAARELLDLQCTDDPENAFANAMKFLMRAASVRDDFKGDFIHPRIMLEVMVAVFGIESVRNWIRQIGRQITRR